jgi:hypothetical protein
MRVGIIQSCYIPWRGYFDFIKSVDLFIIFDDIQYTLRDWRNRNRIKTRSGLKWLTVPVIHISRDQLIENTVIDYTQTWQRSHRNQFQDNYRHAPFNADAMTIFESAYNAKDDTISRLNVRFIKIINEYLDIKTPMKMSSEFKVTGSKTSRLINLLSAVGAKTYLSGPSADDYLDKESFRYAGIRLEYKSYDYLPYSQQWGVFAGNVSVLDLIANCGPESYKFIHSNSPDLIIVP